jgi:hypothetical protein
MRWSGPLAIVARVWPRYGHGRRPLNAIVRPLQNMRGAIVGVAMLISVEASAADIPRTFGEIKFGMPESELERITGADFSSWCASCPPDGDEINLGPEQFTKLATIFPGLTPPKWMPQMAVTLLTTKKKLSGVILTSEEKGKALRSIVEKRLGKPQKFERIDDEVIAIWRSRDTRVEVHYNNIRIFDRNAYGE